jgi:malonyl-CoA/methylmalonyl-CoA synthetase
MFKRAEAHGDRVAIIKAGEPTTYGDLLAQSAAIAACLLDSADDLNEAAIAFAAPGGSEYAAIQWGIWRAGGMAIPLNIHATLPEMRHCTKTANVKTLIALKSTADHVRPLCKEAGIALILLDDMDFSLTCHLPNIALSRRAMILFTSGTTNKPKGVVSTHKNIEAQITTLIDFWQWHEDDVIPLFLPMHHVHGIINVLCCGLWAGATVEAFREGFDITAICDRVKTGAFSVFMAVPTIYVKLIQALEKMPHDECDAICAGFKDMRLMISGSAALPVKIHENWQALTGQVLLERYGMTEIGMALSNPMEGERRPGSVGVPLPGVEIQLVTEEGQVVIGEDTPGEIQVKGDTVFLEYWQNKKATTDSFKDGWFVTGDMAVLEGGYYRIMGRLSVDIIKSGGYKLSALEIENYLLANDAISECAVVGIDDETWGEVVGVAVVLKPNTTMTLEELKSWAEDKISNYKTPRRLVTVDGLPRNTMGKVTKADVKKLF